MAEGLGLAKPYFSRMLERRRFDVCEESNGGVLLAEVFQDDERLEKRCVLFCGIFQEWPEAKGRRGCNGSGKDADFGVARLTNWAAWEIFSPRRV